MLCSCCRCVDDFVLNQSSILSQNGLANRTLLYSVPVRVGRPAERVRKVCAHWWCLFALVAVVCCESTAALSRFQSSVFVVDTSCERSSRCNAALVSFTRLTELERLFLAALE